MLSPIPATSDTAPGRSDWTSEAPSTASRNPPQDVTNYTARNTESRKRQLSLPIDANDPLLAELHELHAPKLGVSDVRNIPTRHGSLLPWAHGHDEDAQLWREWLTALSPHTGSLLASKTHIVLFPTPAAASPLSGSPKAMRPLLWGSPSNHAGPLLWAHQPQDMFAAGDLSWQGRGQSMLASGAVF